MEKRQEEQLQKWERRKLHLQDKLKLANRRWKMGLRLALIGSGMLFVSMGLMVIVGEGWKAHQTSLAQWRKGVALFLGIVAILGGMAMIIGLRRFFWNILYFRSGYNWQLRRAEKKIEALRYNKRVRYSFAENVNLVAWLWVFIAIVGITTLAIATSGKKYNMWDARIEVTKGDRVNTVGVTTEIISKTPVIMDARVTAKSLRVRSGPSTAYQVIGYLSQNQHVILLERNADGSWVRFYKGWISSLYLDTSKPIDILPIAQIATPTYSLTLPRSRQEICTCTYNAYDCKDFSSQQAAQACYQYCLDMTGRDVHWLDDDKDGIACERNP